MPRRKKETEQDMTQDNVMTMPEPMQSIEAAETVSPALEAQQVPPRQTPTQMQSAPQKKEYAPTDLIPCRSMVQGALTFKGTKSQNEYRWDGQNDIVDVEYQDLRSARVSRHPFLTRAYFLIEDEELLALDEWSEVDKAYKNIYSKKDLTAIFKMDNVQEMVKAIENLPDGIKAQMGGIAKGLMDRGALDSLTKIKAIDRILGTDLMLFVGGEGNA